MQQYCEDSGRCRHAMLLEYFGERWEQGRCGDRCDTCIARAAGGRQSGTGGGSAGRARAGAQRSRFLCKGRGTAAGVHDGFQTAAFMLQPQGSKGRGATVLKRVRSMQQMTPGNAEGWQIKKSGNVGGGQAAAVLVCCRL
jgi:hypothetical protein